MKAAWPILVLLGLLLPLPATGEEIAIGFETLPRNLIVETGQPAGMVFREATTLALVRPAESDPGYELVASDRGVTGTGGASWSFHLRDGLLFSDGTPVTVEDALASLEACLKRSGEALTVSPGRFGRTEAEFHGWLTVEGVPDSEGSESPRIPGLLTQCPIFSALTLERFGADFGIGGNFVSSGSFAVVDFKAGKHFVLQRIYRGGTSSTDTLVLEQLQSPEDGLSALRSGRIQLFFTEDQEVIERAKKDETLFAAKCSIYSVVLRKGISMRCDPSLRVDSLQVGAAPPATRPGGV